MQHSRKWWKEGVVYQIYPRSFQDTNGDGIGDLKGIASRLDYIQSLGVDIIWLNPIYESPNDDNGYDISDYRNIMHEFGTMQDFDLLLGEIKSRGLKLILDLVVNHTSDEHPWFVASRSSRDNAFRDYYHWWDAGKGRPPKRLSYFDPENNAWKYDKSTDAYYLHYFSGKQPDLNWENPAVRRDIYEMMAFWFEKGIDGFRMDVISFISKDPNFPEIPEKYGGDFAAFYADGPRLSEYLQEMNREVLSRYDIMTVGEAPGVKLNQALQFVDADRKALNMFFQFDLMSLDLVSDEVFPMRIGPWKLSDFKAIFSKWDALFARKGWGSLYLDNHDFPRAVSRWGNDSPVHWYRSATMLHTFLLSMRGTPFIYYGEEIGMTNIGFETIGEYRDINTLNKYEIAKKRGDDLQAFLNNEKQTSRDNARTPMQWDKFQYAGFSVSEPWISFNKNHMEGINVADQELRKDSVLNYFRSMVKLRKQYDTLVYGEYELLLPENDEVYVYLRTLQQERLLVILSFTTRVSKFEVPVIFREAHLLISNERLQINSWQKDSVFSLQPYQACIYKLF